MRGAERLQFQLQGSLRVSDAVLATVDGSNGPQDQSIIADQLKSAECLLWQDSRVRCDMRADCSHLRRGRALTPAAPGEWLEETQQYCRTAGREVSVDEARMGTEHSGTGCRGLQGMAP
ncbi:hypothetical protein H920_02437 [Fukomys damarensis]|uniref:Uncharacterized protein n=1 Tax=Fukomys damarensis TaxID=885580 RepID=A0A091E131_FUKDA|nr:hypothetical protein H920_02437 [Fukomys damarensis]